MDFGKDPFGRVPGHSWQGPFFPRITRPWIFGPHVGDFRIFGEFKKNVESHQELGPPIMSP